MTPTTKLNEALQGREISSVEVNANSVTLHLAGEETSATICGDHAGGLIVEIRRTTVDVVTLWTKP